MHTVCDKLVLLAWFLWPFQAHGNDTKKGLNIDVSFSQDTPVGRSTPTTSLDGLMEVSRPVPYVEIVPNELEKVNRMAEIVLENETLSPVMHEEYYRIMSQLGELSPEEMLSDLISHTNSLEALKAELGAEERIARMELSGRQSNPQMSIPVSYPLAVDPNTMPNYM